MSLAEIIPNIRTLSAADKLRLIRILAEDFALKSEFAPLECGRTYDIATPIFKSGAAEILQQELRDAAQE